MSNAARGLSFASLGSIFLIPFAALAQQAASDVPASAAPAAAASTSGAASAPGDPGKVFAADAPRHADCDKTVEVIAMDKLTPEQRKTLTQSRSFLKDFGPMGVVNDIRDMISVFRTGATEDQHSYYEFNAQRANAIIFKALTCKSVDKAANPPAAAATAAVAETASAASAALAVSAPSKPAAAASGTLVARSKEVTGREIWKVAGVGGREGYVTGIVPPGSILDRLQIGMKAEQVIVSTGRPDDQHISESMLNYLPAVGTGMQLIFAYKGMGRLVFTNVNRRVSAEEMFLSGIDHNQEEAGKIPRITKPQ